MRTEWPRNSIAIRGDGVYRLVKDLIGSDIVVDIISGTSAGGINGVMLGYALANGREFTASANLWRDQGDIQQLLRKENDPAPSSILNSRYFQEKLEACYEGLPVDRSAPDVEELDLFITGTDANGDIYTVYDDQGHPIDVKNHRALFKLAYRKGGRKNDFDPVNSKDLATLSRLTSCFPVAFEPVRIEQADQKFFSWGKLRSPAVYMDGGILHNKPFTSTIDCISRRTSNREVERFLIYVEPDPESFPLSPDPAAIPNSPMVVQAGVNALLSIPGYQSIAADLDAIQAHNERAQRIEEIVSSLPESTEAGLANPRQQGVILDARLTCDSSAYLTARFIQLRDTAVQGIFNEKNGTRAYISKLDDRRSGRILVESFNAWPGSSTDTLREFDVFFRMRRADYLSRVLMKRAKAHQAVPAPTWDGVNHFFKLYEMAEWALVSWLNAWTYNWRRLSGDNPDLDTQLSDQRDLTLEGISTTVWGDVERHLKLMVYADVAVPTELTAEAREDFYTQLAKRLTEKPPSPAAPSRNLLAAIDEAFANWLSNLPDDEVATLLKKEFCRFLDIDRQILPVLLGSEFESTDTIRVVRFSPKDAQRGNSKGDVRDKVCGSSLNAFGGFFKKSWRANDIMVGRFDGSCQLMECLLTKERLAAMGARKPYSPADMATYFPTLDEFAAVSLAAAINTYLADPERATPEQWSQMMDQLVRAYHKGVYEAEGPIVQKCALEQEYVWGRYRRTTKPIANPYDPKNLIWAAGKAKPDQVLVETAAYAISSGNLPPYRAGMAAGAGFLDQVPGTVLEELGFLAIIRAGKSILASVSNESWRERIRSNMFYRWPIGFLTPLLYRWARMRRMEPESIIVLNTAIPVACLTAFFLAIGLLILKVPIAWTLVAWLLGIPVALFAVWSFWFRK